MALSVGAPTAGVLPIIGAVVIGTINGGVFEQYIGPSYKAPVRVATTVAGTLATSFENGDTIDGIVVATGDRILIKNQAAPADNGIYVVAATGSPSRATDMDAWSEVPGSVVGVLVGTSNADTAWICTSDTGGTLGSTAINFSSFGTTIATPVAANLGGTGVANNASSTITISGSFGTTFTVTGTTSVTLPTSGTLATTATFGAPPAIGNVTPAAITGSSVTVSAAGALKLGNNAVTGLVAGALAALTTSSVTIQDATGTTYRVPCITP